MNKKDQQIAIAKACGWTRHPNADWKRHDIYVMFNPAGDHATVPDYLNDLNAMHEAERYQNFHLESRLDPKAQDYRGELMKICLRDMSNDIFSATAAQRAEAYLKTLNLWEP